VLPAVLEALGGMNVRVVVATAGRAELTGVPANVECFDFVPGAEVARRAALVVSNGGSTTSYQALAEGTPVLGLPSNFDQYLAMTAIERAGAGILVKARQANATSIRAAVSRLLGEPSFRRAAGVLAERTARLDSGAAFRRFVARALAGTPRAEATPPLRSSVG
jgi:UDP:flavonoid glycosyltransferase YjiC (YdhE family)